MSKPTDDAIAKALEKSGGNKAEAANILGCSRSMIWRYSKRYESGIEDQGVREARDADRKISQLKEQLEVEKRRRVIAENDLHQKIDSDAILKELSVKEVAARKVVSGKNKPSGDGCTAIVCANDWHLEKLIRPSSVSGLNEFDLDIAARRIDKLWSKSVYLIDFFKNIANVNEVILWLGGDLINNYLHEEDMESNLAGPAEAIGLVQDHVATGISHLTDNVGLDRVICNYGNHARTTRYMHPGTGWKTSWEYLAYVNLSKIYKWLPFQIAQGYMNYADVQGYKVRFHHGESVKYYGGVGSLTIPMNKSIQAWDKSCRCDLSINAHFHQYLDYWSWVSCGCLCGYDAFAQSIKAEFQEPTQTVTFVDKSRGKVLSIPIFVESPRT